MRSLVGVRGRLLIECHLMGMMGIRGRVGGASKAGVVLASMLVLSDPVGTGELAGAPPPFSSIGAPAAAGSRLPALAATRLRRVPRDTLYE
jgi:hypothetical protein